MLDSVRAGACEGGAWPRAFQGKQQFGRQSKPLLKLSSAPQASESLTPRPLFLSSLPCVLKVNFLGGGGADKCFCHSCAGEDSTRLLPSTRGARTLALDF